MERKWKRIVDNKMHGYADIDYDKKIIRLNKSVSKNKETGDILNSIVHEEQHRVHPKMHEKNVRKRTERLINKMSQKQKQKYFNKFS